MILAVNGVEFSYSSRIILDKVGFSVQKGEFLSILGNNGAGKSTLLKTLNRILLPQKGSILLDNQEVSKLSRLAIALKMAYVSQHYESNRQTVFDAVLLGRKPHIKWEAAASDLALVQGVLAKTGLEEYALRYLDELSGGELQKVIIARALAQEPEVLLLDEPTSNLDLRNQIEVLRTIQTAAKEKNIAVVAVMHDLNLALRFSDKFLLLQNTQVFAAGGPEVMTAANISQAYGVPVSVERVQNQMVVIPT
ncbi:ABC transporter ATP-binding protein [Desulfosporosinus meridiei]|uniref:ABC-type cobalamin/Fe3+-siderophore transport system, ATPase component n=1 Tax=Desulfosporosinus meridiei (strain ATCC BAA-275 / DSM 13257 / KCTC 12902 / NCIMB 13706 / S10) TaxID=768704 RepID=J7ILG6_DESMD|nr:ABC transporter ATP-binding protein [Desulfosporosinus meridiei]AFQ42637.1 ABC-type cobalamin/Fe3+-siderophore transport system, ATPase component [Desulfosporosinus meridiei DSM 13257]